MREQISNKTLREAYQERAKQGLTLNELSRRTRMSPESISRSMGLRDDSRGHVRQEMTVDMAVKIGRAMYLSPREVGA